MKILYATSLPCVFSTCILLLLQRFGLLVVSALNSGSLFLTYALYVLCMSMRGVRCFIFHNQHLLCPPPGGVTGPIPDSIRAQFFKQETWTEVGKTEYVVIG